ncbi:hypothetical protein Tco_1218168 [Tanacetum coccineum]
MTYDGEGPSLTVNRVLTKEENFPVASFLAPKHDSDSEVGYMFEEEYIRPSMMEEDGGDKIDPVVLSPRSLGTEKVYGFASPCKKGSNLNGERLNADTHNNEHINVISPRFNDVDCPHPRVSSFDTNKPSRINGLSSPYVLDNSWAHSFVENSFRPNNDVGHTGLTSQDKISSKHDDLFHAEPVLDLNVTLNLKANSSNSDEEFDELFSSFQHLKECSADCLQPGMKKKIHKSKNKKLLIDDSSTHLFTPQSGVGDPSDDNNLIKSVDEQLGFSFPQQLDDQRSQ